MNVLQQKWASCSSKDGFKKNLTRLVEPLEKFMTATQPGHLRLGSSGTVYPEKTREIEAFLRPLWGLGPLWTNEEDLLIEEYLTGIKAGTDPENAAYWGNVTDFDQLIVEMASLSTTFLLNKEKVWDRLTDEEQQRVHAWLLQVNAHTIPRNNWHFFRILVNCAMKKMGQTYSEELIQSDLAVVDSFYKGKGWYCDGVDTQIDYYVSFAIHYYGLVFSKFMEQDYPEWTRKIKERATVFAQSFKYWFDDRGEALPFGRSLSYRFAQSAFWSALVFADVEALSWGEIKGLLARNMEQWLAQEILTTDDVLSIGYHYQNLVFAEGYNGPGSPYWSLKTFLILAVPDHHPFWQSAALPLSVEQTLSLPESRNYYHYSDDRRHLTAYPAGQFVNFQSHASAKYSKFAYSTVFGFSTPKSNHWYYEGAYDSCLALAEDDHDFRTKGLDEEFAILADRITHTWRPWSDVLIKSTIIPLTGGHVRIHEIETKRELDAYEGSYSVPFEGSAVQEKSEGIYCQSTVGTSGIIPVKGYSKAAVIRTEPNTNLFFPLTKLPYAKAHLTPGKHLLVAVIAGFMPDETWQEPSVFQEDGVLIIRQSAKQFEAALTN